jgi:phospholipid transport system substrate-binding protein
MSTAAFKLSMRRPAAGIAALFALLATLTMAQPARAETATGFMQRVAAELVTASKSGSTSMFAAAIRKHADVQWLGLYSLGSYARAMSVTDRPTYFNGMINFIARYVAKESPKYPVASAVITGTGGETREGTEVDSRVTLKTGETYDVRWLVVRRGDGFKVRDAQVMGFWSSPFLKNLFENYISENGGNPKALVVALNR